MTLTHKRAGLAALAAALLAGCGPTAPVDTDVQQAGANVIFGAPTASPAPPQLVFVNPIQSFPSPVEQPPALPPPPITFAPNPCPTLSPLSYPAQDANPAPIGPPAAATYPFTYTGALTTNGGTPSEKAVQLPVSGTRQVENVKTDATTGSFTYDVKETFNGIQTTTTFAVYPQGYAGTLPATNGVAPGMYITEVQSQSVGNTDPTKVSTFQPVSPLEVFTFPAGPGASWTSSASDPVHNTTVVLGQPTQKSPTGTATVSDHVRVNACGQPIDAWEATMTGTIETPVTGPNSSAKFTLTLDLATQYGGLVVGDSYSESYNDTSGGGSVPTTYSVQSTINVVPSS